MSAAAAPRASLAAYRLPLRAPFRTATTTWRERRGWVLRLEDGEGLAGYGEAAPLPGFGGGDPDRVRAGLTALAQGLAAEGAEGRADTPEAVAALLGRLAPLAPEAPAALAALDLALCDLAARRAELPLARWLAGGPARESVPVNATVGALPPAEVGAAVARARSRGFSAVKLKLGDRDAELDLARVAAAREAGGPEVALRGDVNGAWDEARARRRLAALEGQGLAFVEQPVPAAEIAALARLREESGVPLAADEALLEPDGPARVLAAEAADLLVLKPALLGGPSAALELARRAEAQGLGCVVTSALDGAVGRVGALHLAAALPSLPHACGLATGGLLAEDLAPPARIPRAVEGRIPLPSGPGLGLAPALPAAAWRPLAA